MSVYAGEAAAGYAGARAGREPGERSGSVLFAAAIVLLGLGFLGLYIAFHDPAQVDATTGDFPGLLGAVLNWMHAQPQKSLYELPWDQMNQLWKDISTPSAGTPE